MQTYFALLEYKKHEIENNVYKSSLVNGIF